MRFVESSSKKQGLNSRILDFTCIYSRDRQRHNELNSNPGWGRIPSQRLLLDNLQREKSFRCWRSQTWPRKTLYGTYSSKERKARSLASATVSAELQIVWKLFCLQLSRSNAIASGTGGHAGSEVWPFTKRLSSRAMSWQCSEFLTHHIQLQISWIRCRQGP